MALEWVPQRGDNDAGLQRTRCVFKTPGGFLLSTTLQHVASCVWRLLCSRRWEFSAKIQELSGDSALRRSS